ncbi:hypothetical protein [Thalassotalea fusca]
MKQSMMEIYSATSTGENRISYADFKIGSIELAKHLDVTDLHGVLSVNKKFVNQLLLNETSELESGRVPIYVCNCCGDLGCGALTVKIEFIDGFFVWSDFGYENNYETGFHQNDYMKRTGPFKFSKENYQNTINAYT